MKLLPEDLEHYINHYQKYLVAIKRLDDELLELETMLNRLPGSIAKISDSTRRSNTTRQVQILFEMDQLIEEKSIYQLRTRIVDAAVVWEKENAEWFIINHRKQGSNYDYISFVEKQPKTTVVRLYKENISDFVNFWNNSKKNVI